MKTLLIDPPFYRMFDMYNRYFPYSLVTLATHLKHAGHDDIKVYDADFNESPNDIDYAQLPNKYREYLRSFKNDDHPVWKEVEETLLRESPDIVGIGIWTTFAASAFHVAKIAKKVLPDCTIVLGGPHATAKADEVLRICPHVDYVVVGEGEHVMAELVGALKSNSSKIDSIPGLAFRGIHGIISNKGKPYEVDLSSYSFPDRTLLINKNSYTSEDMGLMMTSRGCPYHCTYCSTQTKRVSYYPTDLVIAEIMEVKRDYGTTQFTFKDDTFSVNRKKVIEFCEELIRRRININWECNTRINLINESLLKIMKKAGCNSIKIGIESGSATILKGMKKGLTKQQMIDGAKLFKKVGIHWTGYFMMGVPGETEQDIRDTVDFLHELKPDVASIGVYEPFPGTAMFEDGVNRKLVNPDMTLEDFYNIIPNYYYRAGIERQTDQIPQERFIELEAEVKATFHRYNKRLPRAVKLALSRSKTYFYDPRMLFVDFRKYLSY